MPQDTVLHFDLQFLLQLGFQLFNTGVIILILAVLLYVPVKVFLQKRSDRIAGQLDNAEKTLAQSQLLKTEYEDKLKDIDIERERVLENALKIAREREDSILAEAKEEAARIIERANAEITQEKAKVKDEVKTQIIEVSSLLTHRYLVENIDTKTQSRLLDEVIQGLEEVVWQN